MGRYDADTPVLGGGTATAGQVERWFAERGPGYATRYAPDGQYRPAPAGIGAAIVAEATRLGLNHDLAAAQILHETAAWQSRFARERNNPGGLGAVNNNPDAALRFATPAEGIRAHMAHLATYARGDGPWTADDPRYAATPVAWRGAVRALRDLDGKWAYPGVGYGATIARLANELLEVTMPSAQIPGFLWEPADEWHFTPGRTAAIRGGAQHYSAGTNSLAWLTRTSGVTSGQPVSAHFLVAHEPTLEQRGWQLVRIEDTAWTTAFANPYTVAIEYEHDGKQPIPDMAYEVLARTWAEITQYVRAQQLGDIAVVQGHRDWIGQPRYVCPDGIDVARIVARWRELIGAAQPDPALYLTYADGTRCPHPIIAGFRAWIEAQGRARGVDDLNAAILSVAGYPQEAEWRGADGRTYQRFERLTLQWTPGMAPPWDIVVLPCSAALPARAE